MPPVESSKPVVLVIENAVEATGSFYSILRSSELLSNVFTFEFILPREGMAAAIARDHGFKVHIIRMREIHRRVSSLILYLPALVFNTIVFIRLLRRTAASLVVNNDFYNLVPAVASAAGVSFRYVCYVRFMPSRFPPWLSGFWYRLHERFAHRIIAVSEAVGRELPASDKNIVVYNNLPMQIVPLTSSTEKMILFPANYISGKGQDLALDVFAGVLRREPGWKLRFVGGDMGLQKNKVYRAQLVQRANELGIADSVEFHEFALDMTPHYQQAAVVLNFSQSESFSLTTLEAQYHGRAVVVTRCGGPEEIVVHGETGFLVPLRDTAEMSRALQHLLASPAERNAMGARAYHSVRERFHLNKTIGKLAEVYQRAIEK